MATYLLNMESNSNLFRERKRKKKTEWEREYSLIDILAQGTIIETIMPLVPHHTYWHTLSLAYYQISNRIQKRSL
jgi:hypothetical protein